MSAAGTERPVIALTIGDPAGVGPEITVRALADPEVAKLQRAIVIGDHGVVAQAVEKVAPQLEIRLLEDPRDVSGEPGTLDLLDLGNVPGEVRHGSIDAVYGRAAMDYIERSAELVKQGLADGIVTGPINKEAIRAAGATVPGHTELLAQHFGVDIDRVFTMFVLERMRIFFLTRHHSLRDAIDLIDEESVFAGLVQIQELMRSLGYEEPKLAVAALNPHAGEHGLMGHEEDEIISPAIERARDRGIRVVGPVPADSVFWQARQGSHDAVLSLYHDQGHIAAKTVSFFSTVSCTLGLPVIRTAAEHGTAFDIAGRWIANAGGQIECMKVAAELAPRLRA